MNNNFAGQSLYDQFLYQFYNLFYTAVPIIIYAVFDRQFKEKELLTDASHYKLGQQSKQTVSTLVLATQLRSCLQGAKLRLLDHQWRRTSHTDRPVPVAPHEV